MSLRANALQAGSSKVLMSVPRVRTAYGPARQSSAQQALAWTAVRHHSPQG